MIDNQSISHCGMVRSKNSPPIASLCFSHKLRHFRNASRRESGQAMSVGCLRLIDGACSLAEDIARQAEVKR